MLGKGVEIDPFVETGEPLDTVVEMLREILKCRKTRDWIQREFDFDIALSPRVFQQLLDIPAINFVETSSRDLGVKVVSLKETRGPDDPVTIGNLNAVLRELYRTVYELHEKKGKEYPNLLLDGEMTSGLVETVARQAAELRARHGKLTGYLLTGGKVKGIERDFREAFPKSVNAHPLRDHLEAVERELAFYRNGLALNQKWRALNFDSFRLIQTDGFNPLMENLQELGNLLWAIVYKSSAIPQCFKLIGVDFSDLQTVFDNEKTPIRNF